MWDIGGSVPQRSWLRKPSKWEMNRLILKNSPRAVFKRYNRKERKVHAVTSVWLMDLELNIIRPVPYYVDKAT